jgi:hypothetical protein|tara:strand:+ start:207 stop:578 length:372 start_codon:yes stop_codon:yes gene_type:complete
MTTPHEDDPVSTVRFKRRKVTHPKRVCVEEHAPAATTIQASDASVPVDTRSPFNGLPAEDPVPNLKEILRNRRRPRDRTKEVVRKAEEATSGLVTVDAPREGHYTGRFVAQTGQVVDRDDKQM